MRMAGEVLEGCVEGLCGDKTNPLSIIASADAAVGQHGLKGGRYTTHTRLRVYVATGLIFLTELAMKI